MYHAVPLLTIRSAQSGILHGKKIPSRIFGTARGFLNMGLFLRFFDGDRDSDRRADHGIVAHAD